MAGAYRDCVLLLGDSLTCGQAVPNSLVARFNAVYYDKLDILNRGVNGYNTSWYLPLMDRILAKHEPTVLKADSQQVRLVTIWFGANDAHSPEIAPRWGVPLSAFRSNLIKILQLLTSPDSPYAIAHSSTPLSIILITPPFVLEEMLDHPGKLVNGHIRDYRDTILEIEDEWRAKQGGERWRIATVDLFGALQTKTKEIDDPRELYTDGLHLTTAGYDLLWTEIERVVRTDFKGMGIDWNDETDLKPAAPSWQMILDDTSAGA